MITNCTNCGEPITIVPAGVSKKTGKPYGSFWKCKACGKGESVGPKPQGSVKTEDARLDDMDRKLDSILRGLKQIYDYIRESDAQVAKVDDKNPTESIPF